MNGRSSYLVVQLLLLLTIFREWTVCQALESAHGQKTTKPFIQTVSSANECTNYLYLTSNITGTNCEKCASLSTCSWCLVTGSEQCIPSNQTSTLCTTVQCTTTLASQVCIIIPGNVSNSTNNNCVWNDESSDSSSLLVGIIVFVVGVVIVCGCCCAGIYFLCIRPCQNNNKQQPPVSAPGYPSPQAFNNGQYQTVPVAPATGYPQPQLVQQHPYSGSTVPQQGLPNGVTIAYQPQQYAVPNGYAQPQIVQAYPAGVVPSTPPNNGPAVGYPAYSNNPYNSMPTAEVVAEPYSEDQPIKGSDL